MTSKHESRPVNRVGSGGFGSGRFGFGLSSGSGQSGYGSNWVGSFRVFGSGRVNPTGQEYQFFDQKLNKILFK